MGGVDGEVGLASGSQRSQSAVRGWRTLWSTAVSLLLGSEIGAAGVGRQVLEVMRSEDDMPAQGSHCLRSVVARALAGISRG